MADLKTSPFDPPPYMEKGSNGEVVNRVLQFLDSWAKKSGRGGTDIVLDGTLGSTGVRWMQQYQKAKGLTPDGGCGSQTRAQMLKDGFDFIKTAKTTGEKITAFVQPDGETLYWGVGIAPIRDRNAAVSYMHKAHHGN